MEKNMSFLEQERLRIAREQLAQQMAAQQPNGPMTPQQKNQQAKNNAYMDALKAYIGTATYPASGQDPLVGDVFAYAAKGDAERNQLANSLMTGAGVKPKRGDVKNWDANAARKSIIANESYMQALRDMGMYDTPENAGNAQMVTMVSGDYLKNQLADINEKLTGSRQADRNHANWQNWSDLQNRLGEMTEYNAPHFWAYADWLMGDQAQPWDFNRYNVAWDDMDDEAFTREQERLRTQFEGLDLSALATQDNSYQSQTGAYEGQLKTVQDEISRRAKVDRLENMAKAAIEYAAQQGYKDPSVYAHPQGYTADDLLNGRLGMREGSQLASDLSFFINNPAPAEGWSNYAGEELYQLEGYDMLDPYEVGYYNVLSGMGLGDQYIEAKKAEWNRRRATEIVLHNTVYAEDDVLGPINSAATIAYNPIASAMTLIGGVTRENDPNAWIYDLQRSIGTVRGVRGQIWGDMMSTDVLGAPVGTTIYNTLLSMGDMGMAYMTGGALSGGSEAFAKMGMQLIMSSEAAAGTLHADLQRGFTAEQALLHGITDGAIEALTEILPIDSLFTTNGSFPWRVFKTALSEGGEEVASGILQLGIDALYSHMYGKKSEVEQYYQQMVAETGDQAQAFWATLGHYAQDVALQGVSGFMSGGGLGTMTHAANDSQARKTGKTTRTQGNVDALMNIGMSMPETSKTGAIARELDAKKKKGKTYSNYDLGRLTMAIEEETSAELAEAPNKVMGEAIEERLVELGETKENAKALAPVIRQTTRGQKATIKQRAAMKWTDNAEQVVKELTRETAAEDADRAGNAWVGELKGKTFGATAEGGAKLMTVYEATGKVKKQEGKAQEQTATEKAVDKAVERAATKVRVTKSDKVKPTAVAVTVNDGAGETAGNVTRFVEQDGEVKLEVQTEEGNKAVSIDQLGSAEGSGVAAIAAWVEESNEGAEGTHQMSAQEASTMLQVYQTEGGDAGTFIRGFEDAYLAGYSGVESAASGISKQAAQIAWEQGRAEAQADEKTRVERASRARASSEGTVGWLGTASSNAQVQGRGDANALSEAMEGMTESQRTTAEVVQAFAETFKTNVVLFESDADNIGSIQNGSFNSDTNTIYIDINAGAFSKADVQTMRKNGTLGYAMMKTLGHEVTHYLEANSANAYAAYKAAVKQELKNQGEDWATLVRSKIREAHLDGRKMTYAGAEAEVVADASEYMLQNSKFVSGLESGTKGTVKRIVQNFMQKLNEVFANLTGGRRESKALRKQINGVYQYTGNLQQLWDAAMDETLGYTDSQGNQSIEAAEMVNDTVMEAEAEEASDAAVEDSDTEEAAAPDEVAAEEIYDTVTDEGRTLQDVIEQPTAQEIREEVKATKQKATPDFIKGMSQRFGLNIQIAENRPQLMAAYNKQTDTILIGKNASTGEVLYKALAMEMFRSVQGTQYTQDLRNALWHAAYQGDFAAYAADTRAVADMLNEKLNLMGHNRLTAESRMVQQEMNARMAAQVLGNVDSMTALMETERPSLLRKIRNALRNFVNKLRGIQTPAATPIERAAQIMAEALDERARTKAQRVSFPSNFGMHDQGLSHRQSITAATTIMGEEVALGMDETAGDVQYSSRANEIQETMAEAIDTQTESATPQYSIRTWAGSDYVTQRDEAAQRLAKSLHVSVAKAKKWIDDVNSVSAYVLNNKARLDYIPTAVEGVSAFKSNPEYGGSIDMSTICAKRRLATGTLDAIQRELGDVALTKEDFLHIREMMKERGHEVACGLCFVESSRKNLSKYNKQFMDQYNSTHQGSELTMGDLNTVDGLERLRLRNQEAYAEYEKFMNKLAQRKPKLFEKRTEYNHEILSKFKSDTTVGNKNLHGGLRLQSFSDFEIVHLIDMMQVITDMASVGLAGQAYTKVPDFAWALGDTGLKINLSLIAKGVDADGNLIFDDVEGMNHNEAKRIRDRYSENVGTIVVTFTDEQLMAAMKSDFVDFIIPFHRSQWQKSDYKTLGLPEGTKDYTMHQNEKQGRKRVKENYAPNEYWNFKLTGKQNAENYLKKCAKDGRTPKFAKFLVNNGDGSYSLQPDGSTDGYWKLLIDFKMYDNQGKGSKQMPVKPNFNMNEAIRMLEEYKGEHDSFPAAQDVVDDFVQEFRGNRGGVKNAGGKYGVNNVQLSTREQESVRDEDVSYATSDDEDFHKNGRIYDYDFMVAQKPISVVTIPSVNTLMKNGKFSRNDVAATGKANIPGDANDKGHKAVTNVYTRRRLTITNNSIRHSLNGPKQRILANAQIGLVIGEVVENGIPVNGLTPTDNNALQTYAMVTPCVTEDGKQMMAVTHVDIQKNEVNSVTFTDIVHSANGRIYKNSEPVSYTIDVEGDSPYHPSRYTISIADLLKDVNVSFKSLLSEDVLEHLEEERPQNGAYTNKVLYSVRGAAPETTVRDYLADADDSMATSVEERNALQIYQDRLQAHAEATQAVLDAERNMKGKDGEELKDARAELAKARAAQREQYNRLIKIESTKHVQSVMQRTQQFIQEEIAGKTSEDIAGMISEREERIRQLELDLKGLKGAARDQQEADIREQKRVVRALKNKATYKLEKLTEEYRTREQKAREYRKTRDAVDKLRRKIGRDVKRLNNLRVRETDQKHVPQEFQHVADAVMRTFTDSALSRLAFSAEKTASLQRTYQALGEQENDFAYYWDDEIQTDIDNLVSLSEVYDALRNREGNAPSYLSLEGVELEAEILQGVDNIVSNVLHMIDTANRNFIEGRQETFEAYANKTGEKLAGHKDKVVLRGKLGQWQTWLEETFGTGTATPIYFFEHLQNEGLQMVYDEVTEGESKYALIVAEGAAKIAETQRKYNYDSWVGDGKLTLKTGNGHEIELTREEAAELYAINKREQANKLYRTEHLLKGGFQYKHIADKGKGLKRAKDESHQLDEADMAKITAWLTDEQKAYADALVGYLSTELSEYGNKTSMDMYGYKKFNENYYIPFKTVPTQRQQQGNEGAKSRNAGTGRLKKAGFTVKVQNKANATLYVGGITETVANHVHEMAAYAAMVEPIEKLKRILNYKVVGEDGSINTIRHMIGMKYGEAAQSYIDNLLKDLNGATESDERATGFTKWLTKVFKRGAVMGSLSVVLQQPTAMARAMAYINPKYFAQNPFYRPGKGTWEKMMKYSGTAVIKDMGKFDVGLGMTAGEYIAGGDQGVFETYRRLKEESKLKAGKEALDRFVEKATSLPEIADKWTWGLIWKAAEKEQAALHPNMDHDSDEFYKMVGLRFDDVVRHTQVYDSVLVKSDLMRSKNGIHQAATAFMSEPTLSLNMLIDAAIGKHNGAERAAIVVSVMASQVLAGALAALVQAWNDDKDKRNWLEKYADRATSNILDNLNPMGMIPYISNIIDVFSGYDVQRPDMEMLDDLISYGKSYIEKVSDPDKELTWKDHENFLGTIANAFGLPLKNISREARRLRNAIFRTDWSEPDAFNVGMAMAEEFNVLGLYYPWSDKTAAYYERTITALINGDEQLAEDYRGYLLDSKAVTEEKLVQGLRDAYKNRYQKGGIEKQDAINFMLDNGLATGDTEEKRKRSAYTYVDKWEEGGENHSAYKSLRLAIGSGKMTEANAEIKEMLNNGWTAKQVYDEVGQDLNSAYMGGMITKQQYQQFYNTHGIAAGEKQMDENDWYWEFKKLDWGKAHGGSTEGYDAYESLYKAVEAGGSGLSKVIKEYQKHGKDREDLNNKLNSYYKPKLIEAKKNGRGFADLQAKVLTAYQLLGYDRQQKLKTIQKWLEEEK